MLSTTPPSTRNAAPVVAETFNYLVAHPVGPVVLKAQLSLPSAKTTTTTSAKAPG